MGNRGSWTVDGPPFNPMNQKLRTILCNATLALAFLGLGYLAFLIFFASQL